MLTGWSDDGAEEDLLADDDLNLLDLPQASSQSDAGFFYDPVADAPQIALAPNETVATHLLRIEVDLHEVPVEVDGKPVGLAPLTMKVAPGSHIVKLYSGYQPTGFMVQVNSDPSEWCFEARGRTFKNVRCL
jgi:hypothetical protein